MITPREIVLIVKMRHFIKVKRIMRIIISIIMIIIICQIRISRREWVNCLRLRVNQGINHLRPRLVGLKLGIHSMRVRII